MYGIQVDQVLASEDGSGEVLWALTDNQGTVRDVVDSDGNVQNHITYDSFGQVEGETNSNVDFRFGYTGRELDDQTGLYYYRARYYDPVTGRFVSEDPIGFAGGDENLYRYVENSPTNGTDPSGLTPIIEWGTPPISNPYPTPNLSPLHERIIERANQLLPAKNTSEWDTLKAILWQRGLLDINKFKNQWVCGYKNIIQAAADEFNIPERLLAAVAWREVGGDPLGCISHL